MMNNEIKISHMEQLAEYRKKLQKKPVLRHLFLELTMKCNENCIHCGSRCGEVFSDEITAEKYREILDGVKADFHTLPMLCITGGEPLLRKDFPEIMGYARKLGFRWGMTSNGTLIDDDTAKMLEECGMGTISVSIDGLENTHDSFRRTKGGYEKVMNGVEALIRNGSFQHVQISTVVTHGNISELDELYRILCGVDIDSWRLITLEPIGRANDHSELALTPDDYRRIFDFIREKRKIGMPLLYGCTHFLGPEYEREVRDWYFLCNAGIYTAGILSNGDITACLDIQRRPETIQGNIYRDRFSDVWKNRFEIFRNDLSEKNEKCRECRYKRFCEGGAYHSWDYDRNEQRVCFDKILF